MIVHNTFDIIRTYFISHNIRSKTGCTCLKIYYTHIVKNISSPVSFLILTRTAQSQLFLYFYKGTIKTIRRGKFPLSEC